MTLLAAFCGLVAAAREFTDIDWQQMERDTLLPYYSGQQALAADYRLSDYSVTIAYPQLEKVSDSEMSQWRLDSYADLIGDWPEVSVEVSSSRGKGYLDYGFVPIIRRNGEYYKLMSCKLTVESRRSREKLTAAVWQSMTAKSRYADESVLNSGRWYKIRVPSTGVYRLSRSFLSKAGFNNPDRVRLYGYGGNLLPEKDIEQLPDDLEELPLWREGGDLLFYARGTVSWTAEYGSRFTHTRNTYSDYGYYFITADDTITPLQVQTSELAETALDTLTTTGDYILYDKDEFSWMHGGRMFFERTDYLTGATQNYSFHLDNPTDDPVNMTVAFSANGSVPSTLEISVNGKSAGKMTLKSVGSNDVATVETGSFTCQGMFGSDNTVRLYHNHQDGISGHLDYIRLNYTRRLVLDGQSLSFRTGIWLKNTHFKIQVPGGKVALWRIGTDGAIRKIPFEMAGGYCVTPPIRSTSDDEYVAIVPDAEFPEPEAVGEVPNQNLHGMDAVDMLIIVPSGGKLTAQAERLADWHRTRDGMSVAVVPADRIYNEFSSGTPDATAYRRFLKMLYDRSNPQDSLQYLLLFGSGAWDNRMVTESWRGCSPEDYLLCYESDNSISKTASYVAEDYYALLDDGKGVKILTEKVDIGVGRFPVTTAEQAVSMVDKCISYMRGDYAGDWRNTVLVLGDDGDNNLHMKQADGIAELILNQNPSLDVRKVYWDAYHMETTAAGNSYPELRKEIFRLLDKGALMVNYTGHGSTDVLSHEQVFLRDDLLELTSPRLPLWVTASCDIAPFDNGQASIGMNAILNDKGGALAMFTTTRTVFSNPNELINRLFCENVLNSANALGDAVRIAKARLVSTGSPYRDITENRLNYVLLGDPALKLAVPSFRAVVDSMQTEQKSDGMPKASAGDKVMVYGHIEGPVGRSDTLSAGYVWPRIYDSRRKIVTRNNEGYADTCFSYYDYDRLLYSGRDSVRNGRFSFVFPVPKDISYSNEHGRMVLYSLLSDSVSANGSYDGFIVGGTSSRMSGDTLGPSMTVCLNTPEFQYWDKVNTTPCFIAELEDESGINSSGNGSGHDMMLQIDNSSDRSYVLTSYYEPLDGDYRRGRVVFSIPALPEGRHTLQFRAWDVLNNSSTATLGFEVKNGVNPTFSSVSLTENPVTDRTSFVIVHDRPGSLKSVTLQITDTGGRVLWNATRSDSGTTGVTVIDWNVMSDAGQHLQSGLYIYKVLLTDGDGGSESYCGKLVVL